MSVTGATFEDVLLLAIIAAILSVPAFFIWRAERRFKERLKRLKPRNTVFFETAPIRLSHPSQPSDRWTNAIVFVTNKHIVAYPTKGEETPLFETLGHEIEGFWRPKKYEEGINGIEIHAIPGGRWTILKVRLYKTRMESLVRALKALVVDEDVVRAYRQRRPYIYRPPADAQQAAQDLYGMWEHGAKLRVYLTPSMLVLLGADDTAERIIRLREIQNVRALNHEDGESAGGLVTFNVTGTGEEVAIAVDDHETWARSIATAAKCILEDPIERKRKGKAADESLDEDFEWDNGDYDIAQWELQEYVLGDDGELQPRAAAGG
jgi:hypothetical protein